MSYEIKENSFSLFLNDKGGNEKRPDYSGHGKINGKEVKIAVWKRTGKTGVEYWSGTIEEVPQPDLPQPEKEPEPAKDLLDDQSIPF